MPPAPGATGRVLVLMPTARDAERVVALLGEVEAQGVVCAGLAELCRELRKEADAVLLTEEIIAGDSAGQLAEAIRAQPAWSAVPVVVVAREGATSQVQQATSEAQRGIIIERPVRTRTLLSVVQSALRARRHQYEIRDAIAARERQAAELSAQEEKLRFALWAGGLGSWDLDLDSLELTCSAFCKTTHGRDADQPFTYLDWREVIHPDDRSFVLAAIEQSATAGAEYNVEYRVAWPDGQVRWVMARGRATGGGRGEARRVVGVTLDVTERKRTDEALRASRSELGRQADQLRDADRRKDEFLATLAHELRNPLAPLRTGVELLSEAPEAAIAQRTLGVMRRQLDHIVRLIDDLLDVSRITRGKLELRRERVSLAAIIDAAVEASRPFVDRNRHDLRVSVSDGSLCLDVDLTRVAQVISNLLNNASKYTPPGGQITLSAARDGGEIVIDVRDNGRGIPADRLDEVFEMFSQVTGAPGAAQGGLGIGLALVRRLVEMHGGSVRAESAGPGAGSTFTVRLPLGPEGEDAHAPEPEAAPARRPAGTRILVVDDNNDAADLLALMLEKAGYLTDVAYDGPSALAAAKTCPPDVVILDIGLPGMSGYDVARALRRATSSVPLALIALTGWGTREDKQRALEAGFDAHLTKPIDARLLHDALAAVERRKGGQNRLEAEG